MLRRRGNARQVSRVDDQNGVELVTHVGPRFDVLHAGDEQAREQLAVAEAAADAGGDLFEQLLARRLLDQAHDGRYFGMQLKGFGVELRFGGGDGRKLRQEAKIAQAANRSHGAAVFQEGSASVAAKHGLASRERPRGHSSLIEYRYSWPRTIISLPTIAGVASTGSPRSFVASTSSLSAWRMTTVLPSRPV